MSDKKKSMWHDPGTYWPSFLMLLGLPVALSFAGNRWRAAAVIGYFIWVAAVSALEGQHTRRQVVVWVWLKRGLLMAKAIKKEGF